MVAYSFKPRFVPFIQDQSKTHTIRAYRKGRSRHARPGDTIQLYTGMRTRRVRLIGYAECLDVVDIRIHLEGFVSFPNSGRQSFTGPRLNLFAASDGFGHWQDFCRFWGEEHPGKDHFEGAMIEWGASFVPAGAVSAPPQMAAEPSTQKTIQVVLGSRNRKTET